MKGVERPRAFREMVAIAKEAYQKEHDPAKQLQGKIADKHSGKLPQNQNRSSSWHSP